MWSPITDLDARTSGIAYRGLHGLARIWAKHRETLGEVSLKTFQEKLHRQWAIETGIIERVYDLDAGVTVQLIEQGFVASLIPHGSAEESPDWIVKVLSDNREALEALFDLVSGRRPLSLSFIKELHATITRNQEYADAKDTLGRRVRVPLIRGDWKRQPNNPTTPDGSVHEYCPPEHVAAEMERLLSLHREHFANRLSPEVNSAWLHHRFTQIHPFQDGNGRVARALATLVFLQEGWLPLVAHREDRSSYLAALRAADEGDLSQLIELFVRIEERSFSKALIEVLPPAEALVDAAAEMLRDTVGASVRDRNQVQRLGNLIYKAIQERVTKLTSHSASALAGYSDIKHTSGEGDRWDKALRQALPANLQPLPQLWRAWCSLEFPGTPPSQMLISVHALGPLYRGVLATVAVFARQGRVHDLLAEPLVVSVESQQEETWPRLKAWLEQSLSVAVARWYEVVREAKEAGRSQ